MKRCLAHYRLPNALLAAAWGLALLGGGCGGANRRPPGADGNLPAADLAIPGPPADLFGGCAAVDYKARQAPAALLVVLDRSESMADNNKYSFAAQAIVQALDQDLFDTMSLGLYAAPSGTRAGPACIFGLPVACQSPPFPQVEIKPAGKLKSGDAMGVRRDIKQWLLANGADQSGGDASPMYDALQNALVALKGWPGPGKRILFVVTDGTLSCNQYSNRPGFPDCNGCDHDWEDPANLVKQLQAANRDPKIPIETFVVGVPGADTFDAKGCMYPPYRMRLALSAIAYAGSPGNVPANCDGRTFIRNGPDPKLSCHFDFTQGNFKAQAIADAIGLVRGKVLGCAFDLPVPDGGVVDRDEVNVRYVLGGNTVELKRRSDPNNQCAQSGCWDYDQDGKVLLLGKACTDVKGAPNVEVKIVVGCPTVIG